MRRLTFGSLIARASRSAVGIIAALTLCVLLLLAVVRASGTEINTISTASMTPTLPVDTLTFTTAVDPSVVFEGDIILFVDGRDRTVMHRVVEIIEHNGVRRFRTKGDRNQTADRQLLHEDQLIGRLSGAVPRAGALVELAGSRVGVLYLLLFQAPIALRVWLGPTSQPDTSAGVTTSRRRPRRSLPRLLTKREQKRLALAPLWLVEP